MAQTTYNESPPEGFAGLLQGDENYSVTASASAAGFTFGTALGFGTADYTAKALAAITEGVYGVVVWKPSYVDGLIRQYDTLSLLKRGQIYVTVEDAVTRGSQAYVRAVASGSEVAGAFRGSADGTDTISLGKEAAQFLTSASAGGLALLSLNLA